MKKLINSLIAKSRHKLDKLWLQMIAIIMLKFMLFLSLIHSPHSAEVNILKMYFAPPPFITQTAFIVLLMSFAFLLRGKKRILYYIIMDTILTILLLGDLWYFRTSGDFLSLKCIIDPKLFTVLKSATSRLYPSDLIFLLDFIFLFSKFKNNNLVASFKTNVRMFLLTVLVSTAYIFSSHYLLDEKNITNGVMLLFRTCWTPTQTMSNLTPLGYHAYDIYNTLVQDRIKDLTESDKKEIEQWYKDNKENLPDNSYKGLLKNKNLIAIQVESLENFVINQKVNGQEITPNLNRLLKNSLYFNNIYEQNNNGTSSDADLMINTSLLPVRSGMTFFRYPDTVYNSLPKLLSQQGYDSFSTHGELGGNYNWEEVHKASLMFKDSWDLYNYDDYETIRGELADGALFEQVEPKIKSLKQPFYSNIVTLSSHGPFTMPDKYKYLKLPKEIDGTILGDYFQSVRYVDEEIGKFLDKLNRDGILENSVVMIYGDHAGVHKFYNDKLTNIKLEGDWWKNSDKKVPLIIYSPGLKGQLFETIGGHTDIMTTIAYLLGVDESKFSDSAMGKILVKTNKNYTLLNYGKIVGNPTSEEKEHLLKSFEISDKVISSNYFKNYKNVAR